MSFHYVAKTTSGSLVRGELNAETRAEALHSLSRQSLFPIKVEPTKKLAGGKRVRNRDVALFYSNLADLLEGGVPLVRSLELLVGRNKNNSLTSIIGEIRVAVANGQNMSTAMREHPAAFDLFAVNIVKAGETGGFLEESLNSLSRFTERNEELRSRIFGAIAYPAFLLFAGSLQLIALLLFFVPRFQVIFDRLEKRGDLPAPTVLLLGMSEAIQEHWLVLIGLTTVLVVSAWSWLKTDPGKYAWDTCRLKLWGIGSVSRQFASARFCHILGTMLQNGVPIIDSLEVSRQVTGNRVMSEAIKTASASIASGNSLAAPLAQSGQFSEELIELIRVGEGTNRLDRILQKAGESLERRANRSLDLGIRLLEPILLLVMAATILFLLLALLLPVLQSADSLS
ncbi:MAG: type II secretion system F family protein [Planctomycetaceae bacterium]|jgi:general secretion pathway protein F/type IV pilus assembly protein PilC|nr:type II secretion system F family protein [Planctomycetaceae bacterium]